MGYQLSLGRVTAYDPIRREGIIQPTDGSPALKFTDAQFSERVTMEDIRVMTVSSRHPELGLWAVFLLDGIHPEVPLFIQTLDSCLCITTITL